MKSHEAAARCSSTQRLSRSSPSPRRRRRRRRRHLHTSICCLDESDGGRQEWSRASLKGCVASVGQAEREEEIDAPLLPEHSKGLQKSTRGPAPQDWRRELSIPARLLNRIPALLFSQAPEDLYALTKTASLIAARIHCRQP